MTADTQDVVFTFSYETYADAVSRGMMRPPDRLVTTLMCSERVRRLLVANAWRFLPSSYARRLLRIDARFPATDQRRLLSPVRWRRSDAADLDGIARDYETYDRVVGRGARAFGLEHPAVITANPLVAGFAPLQWAGGITYFGRDDWSSSPGRQAYWPAYQEAYRRISERGVAVAAVSEQIIERIRPTGPYAVVPNGVEVPEWTGPAPAPPAWFDRIPGPRATYVGTLDSRIDAEGISELAARRPDLQIVLIGPMPDPSEVTGLKRLPNVHVHGRLGRRDVVAVLRASELALLAHRRTPLTEAMSPLKVYEYLAAGAPVIATDLPPVRALGDRVLLVDSVSDFADVVEPALALGRASEAARLAFVEQNSWASRHRAVLDLVLGARTGR
jgi:teichuronic acid biosynthesis glycosyltransferase TuaH